MLYVRMDAIFFSDVVSGAKASRPGLDKMLKDAREDDVGGYGSKIHESLPSPNIAQYCSVKN